MRYRNSRNDSWRQELFYAEIAQQAAARRQATARRHAIMFGIAIGILGSVLYLLQP